MADFKSPSGSFAKVESGQKGGQVRKGGVPTAGITNESKGKVAQSGPGPGVGANSTRIK